MATQPHFYSLLLLIVAAFLFEAAVAGSDDDEGIFTSNIDLQRLLVTEAEILNELKEYIAREEIRIAKLRNYVANYEKIHEEAKADAEKYVGNPLNSYLLIKRLTADWKGVRDLMAVRGGDHVIDHLANKTQTFALNWPTDEDLNGAAIALTR